MPLKGYKQTKEQIQKRVLKKLGVKHTQEAILRISDGRKGKGKGIRNGNWKGIDVGYRSIHSWIERTYGRPTTCEHCQTGNLTGHEIHWASRTKKYVRDREQWLRLCAKCHGEFDKINKLRGNNK